MLQNHVSRSICLSVRGQLLFAHNSRPFSSRRGGHEDEEDLEAARKWYSNFTENTIPSTISETTYSRSSGPGGQKTNKTSSKATTIWPMSSLKSHLPKILHPELRSSRYYVSNSDSILIQSDAQRSQSENRDDVHRKFNEEIRQIYKSRVPGVTSPEQKIKVEQLHNENGTKETKQWLKEGQAAKRQERTSRIDEKLEQALLARLAG